MFDVKGFAGSPQFIYRFDGESIPVDAMAKLGHMVDLADLVFVDEGDGEVNDRKSFFGIYYRFEACPGSDSFSMEEIQGTHSCCRQGRKRFKFDTLDLREES